MRKTFFPSALFGLCSTSLLLLGLSSLRTGPRIFAQSENSSHLPQRLTTSQAESWLAAECPDWANPGTHLSTVVEEPDLELNNASSAWDNGPVADDPSANDPKGGYISATDSLGYRYYYRFIAADSWSEETADATKAEGEDWQWLGNLSDKLANSTVMPEYSFIDEYSSEEAARYEMAQEGDWRAESEGLVDADGYFPWHEKYYYYMLLEPQPMVGGPHSRCSVVTFDSKSWKQAEAVKTMTAAELESIVAAEQAAFLRQPDHEADVAAGWLFAANREVPLEDLDLPAMTSTEIAFFNLQDSYKEEIEDEVYEDWELFEDDVFGESDIEYDANVTDGVKDDASENADAGAPATESSSYPDLGSTLLEGLEADSETWVIVNHEPLVANSEHSEAVQPLTDTPWHGEPGEGFVWAEPVEEEDSNLILRQRDGEPQAASDFTEDHEDQFEWVDPYDDRYYDFFEEETEQVGAGEKDESLEPITGRNGSWDDYDFSLSEFGEAWDYDRPGYTPSETAPPVSESYESLEASTTYRDTDVEQASPNDFEIDNEDSISLRRMGSALLDLIPRFQFWK
ncbi:MAG: hypothetical protein ACUVQG_11105 [Thermogutta sp.]